MSSPKKNVAYDFYISLVDSADTGAFKPAPTIAAGDFKASGNGAAFANLATLPVVDPAGSIGVKVSLSAAEMNFDKIMVQCIDAAGDQWDDVLIFIDATDANVDDIASSTLYAGPRGPGVYLNDAAANTNTVDRVDGTRRNPVSTIVAAKTIADSLSLDRIYLVNNSDVIFSAAMTDYEIIGIGEMMANTVDFGTQDVDRAVFYNLLLTGAQGGTGRCQAVGCVLSNITGMELTGIDVLLAAGSLTLRNDCAFLVWSSAVSGAGAPILNINSVANVNVYMRHGSGGIQVNNAVATTVMSVETDGQLIVDATCTSLTVVPRGNLSVTDNGTTTNIDPDAAINLTNIKEAVADQVWDEAQADHVVAGSFGIIASEIAAIPTTAMRGTDGALTDKTGFSLVADQSGVTIGTVTTITDKVTLIDADGVTFESIAELILASVAGQSVVNTSAGTVTLYKQDGTTPKVVRTYTGVTNTDDAPRPVSNTVLS